MGEEMEETKGTEGEKKEGLKFISLSHGTIPPPFFFFFFIHPCKSKDHLKSTHGHVHPLLHTKSPPHLFESYDIHAGWVYIYTYECLGGDGDGRNRWTPFVHRTTFHPLSLPLPPSPIGNTANPRRR